MLPADLWLDTAVKVFARQKFIDVTRDFRQRERMVDSAHAAPKISEQAVIIVCLSEIISDGHALQSFCSKQLPKYVLEDVQPAAKTFENLRSCSRAAEFTRAIKHPSPCAFFGFHRREVCQSQEILRFEVCALLHKLLAPLVINDPCDRIGECALLGIAGRTRTNRITLNHPPAAKTQD